MPCESGYTQEIAEQSGRMKKELDKVTDMLCRVLKQWEDQCSYCSPTGMADNDIKEWWAEHKKIDDKRVKLDYITINLSPGTWISYFRDGETLHQLTPSVHYDLLETTDVKFEIPEEVRGNPKASIFVARFR